MLSLSSIQPDPLDELMIDQSVRLRLKDAENHQLTGVIRSMLTDFCFDVACSDE